MPPADGCAPDETDRDAVENLSNPHYHKSNNAWLLKKGGKQVLQVGALVHVFFRVLILWPGWLFMIVSVPKFQVSGKNLDSESLREICVLTRDGVMSELLFCSNLKDGHLSCILTQVICRDHLMKGDSVKTVKNIAVSRFYLAQISDIMF